MATYLISLDSCSNSSSNLTDNQQCKNNRVLSNGRDRKEGMRERGWERQREGEREREGGKEREGREGERERGREKERERERERGNGETIRVIIQTMVHNTSIATWDKWTAQTHDRGAVFCGCMQLPLKRNNKCDRV